METVANNSWFSHTAQYTNTMAGNLPPFHVLLPHTALFYPPARMEEIRGERKKHEQKEVADADLLPRVLISVLPGSLFCGPLLYRHKPSDIPSQWGNYSGVSTARSLPRDRMSQCWARELP